MLSIRFTSVFRLRVQEKKMNKNNVFHVPFEVMFCINIVI